MPENTANKFKIQSTGQNIFNMYNKAETTLTNKESHKWEFFLFKKRTKNRDIFVPSLVKQIQIETKRLLFLSNKQKEKT